VGARLLIAGCGDLGVRLADRLTDRWQVTGLRRSADRLPDTVEPFAADLADPATLRRLPRDWDAVIHTATPDARDEAAYRRTYLDGFRHLVDHVRAGRLVFVSSTAVYGQDGGEWVDEDAETAPQRFNGQVLLQGEAIAREAGGCVLRFSGIYGPGREALIERVRSGPVGCRREPPVWTNRIHADDCATALDHLLHLPEPDPVYLASDDAPTPRWDVLSWLAERLGAPGPTPDPDPRPEASAGQGKRVSAARLKATGFALQYPDFRSGYEALLACD
jgi:nucleoside-diphosphate-sugar epimerase